MNKDELKNIINEYIYGFFNYDINGNSSIKKIRS